MTPAGMTPGSTPFGASDMMTPSTPGAMMMGGRGMPGMPSVPMTPEQIQARRWEMELDERNRPLSDEDLDALFPMDGYFHRTTEYPTVPHRPDSAPVSTR
jgi:splicing factor 3B subunit 1